MTTYALVETGDETSADVEEILAQFEAAHEAERYRPATHLSLAGSATDAAGAGVGATRSQPSAAPGPRHIQLRRGTLAALSLFLLLAAVDTLSPSLASTPTTDVARLESDMRSVLALIVEQVEAERVRSGRVPAHLAVAALATEETIIYERVRPDRYRVVLAAGPLRVEFDSAVGSPRVETASSAGRHGPSGVHHGW